MVLREEVQLDIGDFKLAVAGKADPPRELPGGIENIYRILGNLPVFFAGRDVQPDLEVMRPQTWFSGAKLNMLSPDWRTAERCFWAK